MEALGQLERALNFLNDAAVADLPAQVRADALRALERAESKHTAARARVLAAFTAQDGYEDDGHGSARTWLMWQTRVTRGAAAGAVGWARRLAAHPVIGRALAAGMVSASWAKKLCEWSDRLPEGSRGDADEILAGAAAAGADLTDLAGLAAEMYQRSCAGTGEGQDGFDDREIWLGTTLGGAGRLEGDLTPGCAAALTAVLEALGKKAGPEDLRTAGQRRHDALEEACRRLIASGMLPGRAGQPTRLHVHMSLSQLRGLPGAGEAERAWIAAQATTQTGWLTGPAADAAACDATITPAVTGHLDPAAVDELAAVMAPGHATALAPATRERLRRALPGLAIRALSGPGGLAAALRARLTGGPVASVSLPLDVGAPTEIIPAHLRRAATLRHPRCAFPGCDQPASVCDIHHLVPRARGGPTALHNLAPACTFHHLIAIHRWGWTLRLNPDGTTTATSPDGTRVLHSGGSTYRGQAAV